MARGVVMKLRLSGIAITLTSWPL